MLHIKISPGSDVPIFRQIVDQVRVAVASEKIATGDSLPSVRALASDLVVNPNTIVRAYSELTKDGVIESQRGRGFFVAKRRDVFTKRERHRRILALVQPLVAEAKTLGFSDEELLELIQEQLLTLTPVSEPNA